MFIGIAFLLIGAGMLLQQLGYLSADINLFWAIIFIAIGLSVLFGKKKRLWHGWHGCCGDWKKHKSKKK